MPKSAIEIAGTDISKLPPELQKELRVGGASGKRQRILAILEEAPEEGYSINEVLVLYYKRFNDVLARTTVQSHVAALTKEGDAERIAMGQYVAKNDG